MPLPRVYSLMPSMLGPAVTPLGSAGVAAGAADTGRSRARASASAEKDLPEIILGLQSRSMWAGSPRRSVSEPRGGGSAAGHAGKRAYTGQAPGGRMEGHRPAG